MKFKENAFVMKTQEKGLMICIVEMSEASDWQRLLNKEQSQLSLAPSLTTNQSRATRDDS